MKLIKYFSCLVLATFFLTSCKKDLELYPTDSFNPSNAFRVLDDVQLGVNEAYGRFGTRVNGIYQSALLSDEAKLGKDNAGQGALTYRYQFSADATTGGDVTSTFGGYYYAIDQINRVLTALPNITITNSAEDARRSVLKGQLLGLRAICHYYLLETYAKAYDPTDAKGIAYMKVSDVAAKPARDKVTDVLGNIETDINDAMALLPSVTLANFSDTVINQLNLTAYRAKIALYKKDYANAITYATTVINSAIRPISSGVNFQNIWTDATTTQEVLFRTRFLNSTSLGGLFTTTGGLIYISPSDKLRSMYGTGDIRLATYIGGTDPGFYVNKHYVSSRGARMVDLKDMRIAEMYLIRAEAYAKQSSPNLSSGAADLNTLRSNRITGYVNQTFASASDLINAIMDERMKELCFEGTRFFDLKRNNLPVLRNASDVGSSAWQTLAANDYRFALPIPQYEILANPNMVQNDGY